MFLILEDLLIFYLVTPENEHFNHSEAPAVIMGGRTPLLGDGGAFVMGKVNERGIHPVPPRIRGGWLLAHVAILTLRGLSP